jgi:hypothetical protein
MIGCHLPRTILNVYEMYLVRTKRAGKYCISLVQVMAAEQHVALRFYFLNSLPRLFEKGENGTFSTFSSKRPGKADFLFKGEFSFAQS